MSLRGQIASQALGVVLRTLFRPNASPKRMRANFDLLAGVSAERLLKKYPGLQIETGKLAGRATETITTRSGGNKTIYYLHGGGYFMGGIHSYRRNALRLSYQCKAKVVLIDYRLSPEHPFPAGLDDAVAGYRELIKSTPPSQIVLGGDSAGGGLALAMLLRLRDEKSPLPSGAFCLSPYADLVAENYEDKNSTDVWLSKRHVSKWAVYYAGGTSPHHPYISPVLGDFVGFPKMQILVGEKEIIFHQSKRIVKKLEEAGVPVTFEVGPGMQHNWVFSLPFLSEAKTGMKAIAHFVATC